MREQGAGSRERKVAEEAEGARQFTHSRINSEFRIPNSLHYTPHPIYY
ncbi:hypothetical protein [Scytonema millei]|uniref:Uncharacterized protein n=1 Tax=Scytonema millei VB511283 TaxID=1245923 RepID=A0A9X5I429_9CYAN|nr:hypothetical protein [Scytonema millei]NHC34441.1 hypothetical protein [Scytonema millei VB511283]